VVLREMHQPGSARCHVQAHSNQFWVSDREGWATHRRIVGNVWGAGWQLEKAMFAVTADGEDKRVPKYSAYSVMLDVLRVCVELVEGSSSGSGGCGGSSSGSSSSGAAVAAAAAMAAAAAAAVVAAAGAAVEWT